MNNEDLKPESIVPLLNSNNEEDIKLGVKIFNEQIYGNGYFPTVESRKQFHFKYLGTNWRNYFGWEYVRYFPHHDRVPFDPSIRKYIIYL